MYAIPGIINSIYAAALNEESWEVALAGVANAVGARGAFLYVPSQVPSLSHLHVLHELPAPEVQRYMAEFSTVDIWYHQLVRQCGKQLPPDLQWETDALVSPRELQRSRFSTDYLVPCGIGRGLGTMLKPDAWLATYRPPVSESYSGSDKVQLSTLQPHLKRAIDIRQRLGEVIQGADSLAIDRINTAVVLLSVNRTVLEANQAAVRFFGSTDQRIMYGKTICPSELHQVARLESALKECFNYRFDTVFSLSLRIQGAPGSGIVIQLVPFPRAMSSQSQVAAIGFLSREGQIRADVATIMQALYGLTPSEVALVKALTGGSTVEEFAEVRSVGLATVKTQLRSVFAKTGTRRQADLLRLAYSLSN